MLAMANLQTHEFHEVLEGVRPKIEAAKPPPSVCLTLEVPGAEMQHLWAKTPDGIMVRSVVAGAKESSGTCYQCGALIVGRKRYYCNCACMVMSWPNDWLDAYLRRARMSNSNLLKGRIKRNKMRSHLLRAH